MPETEQIEQQIRDALTEETRAIPFSNRLFSPVGLFNQLAQTEEQRRAVARSPLFKEAQKRFLELQRIELAEFSGVLRQAHAATAGENFLIRLENTESN
jgi:hypothetical protein